MPCHTDVVQMNCPHDLRNGHGKTEISAKNRMELVNSLGKTNKTPIPLPDGA